MKKYITESLKYLLRTRPFIGKYVAEIDAMYAMSPEELRARNERRFLEIFRKAYVHSEYYRGLCSSHGVTSIDDIQHLEDIVKLPILTKDILKAHGKELLTRKERGLMKNHTSGTTGTPLTVWQDWASVWREQAYFVCYRKRCGYNYGEPMVSLRGNLGRNDISLKVHVSNTLFLSSYDINEHTAETYHQLIEMHHPKAIEGYPSSLYNLALVLRDKGLECHIPVAFTSSETLHDYQRSLVEKIFHTQIYDHYGTTERTIRLEESFDHDGYFEDPGYGIEEYHDDYVITTSLINDAFPLIRYKTNDRVVLKDTALKTKENFIDYIQGRNDDCLVCKDGTKVVRLGFVTKDFDDIDKAQFVQKEKGSVELHVVSSKLLEVDVLEQIKKNIENRCGKDNMDIAVLQVSEKDIIYSKNLKFKYVISQFGGGGSLTFNFIERVEGRSISYIVGKDGTKYSDAALTFVFKDVHGVRLAQFVQNEVGKIILNVVPENVFSEKDKEGILEYIDQKIGKENMDVDFRLIDESQMQYTKRNKLALVISNL